MPPRSRRGAHRRAAQVHEDLAAPRTHPPDRSASEATMTLALIITGFLIVNFVMAGLFSLVALWAD
ncbi:hypothetical protein SAMN04487845_107256 [Methylobacterium sp. yr668]|nr:hypothetical protein SAMN04487845_107256 [Methylobacterium sp. yr668]